MKKAAAQIVSKKDIRDMLAGLPACYVHALISAGQGSYKAMSPVEAIKQSEREAAVKGWLSGVIFAVMRLGAYDSREALLKDLAPISDEAREVIIHADFRI